MDSRLNSPLQQIQITSSSIRHMQLVGSFVVTASWDGRVHSVAIESGDVNEVTHEHHDPALSICNLPHALYVGCGSGKLRRYSKIGSAICATSSEEICAHSAGVMDMVAFGDLLVTCSWDGYVRVWELLSHCVLHSYRCSGGPVWTLHLAGSRCFAGASDGCVYVINVLSGVCEQKMKVGHRQVWCLKVMGDTCFVGTSDGYIHAASCSEQRLLWSLKIDECGIRRLNVVGSQLYACSKFGLVSVLPMGDEGAADPASDLSVDL